MKEPTGQEEAQPFFTSNPLGLPYNPLPKPDPALPKLEETWMEIVVSGRNREIAEKIEEMKEATNCLDFEQFMEAFEELESARGMQIDELVREIVEMKREAPENYIEKEEPPQPERDVFKKRPKGPDAAPVHALAPQWQLPATPKSKGRKTPALIVVGILAGSGILLLIFSTIGSPTAEQREVRPRVDMGEIERQQRDRGVEEALKYQALAPLKSYDREADEKLQAWSDQQDAIQASRDAATAADEARYAAEDAAADAREQHQEQMRAIEDARQEAEDTEEARRLDSYRKRLR